MTDTKADYDSTPATLEHIRQVGAFLADATHEIVERAAHHDHSKLQKPEKEAFDRETPKLKEMQYGTTEYNKSLEQLGEALQHHYAHNSHHPEHYERGINGMDLFDLLEMVCDWKAAAQRTADGGTVNIEYSVKRFGIDPQIAMILRNTLDRWPGRQNND